VIVHCRMVPAAEAICSGRYRIRSVGLRDVGRRSGVASHLLKSSGIVAGLEYADE